MQGPSVSSSILLLLSTESVPKLLPTGGNFMSCCLLFLNKLLSVMDIDPEKDETADYWTAVLLFIVFECWRVTWLKDELTPAPLTALFDSISLSVTLTLEFVKARFPLLLRQPITRTRTKATEAYVPAMAAPVKASLLVKSLSLTCKLALRI